MSIIQGLNDHELLVKTQALVKEEKRITQLVLDYLQEIDARRLYAKRGFSSLFSFCTEYLGYSESSAQRRISAMRLLRALPEAKEKLEAGSVNLSTLSQLQSFIKKEQKTKNVSLEDQRVLSAIENKSQ